APRSPQESVLGAGLGRDVLFTGALIAAVVLGAGVLAARWDRPWQSVVFVVLGLAQLGVALAVRAPRPARRGSVLAAGRAGNPALLVAVAVSALLQVAGVLVEPLRVLLGTDPLGAADLLACAAVAVLPGVALRLLRPRGASEGPHDPATDGPGHPDRDQRPVGRVRRP
ncbi:cation-translocating P-type ATPase C-terminal domain-containing protein, partial [Micromonospora sp. DH15]|nr:cation-translocating P-type ATPase C-terminal domain-containing protein [Micromonospora sp. DH15]